MAPDRSCDGCIVCCIVPPVKSPDFCKTSGTPCVHSIAGTGCAIHASRPAVCRDWFCGWRALPFLDDRWRPDKSGLLVLPEQDDLPANAGRDTGLTILVWRDREDIVQPFVIDMLAGLVHAGVPTFLSVPGPPGTHPAKALLNPKLQSLAETRDGDRIRTLLLTLHDHLSDGDFEPVDLTIQTSSS